MDSSRRTPDRPRPVARLRVSIVDAEPRHLSIVDSTPLRIGSNTKNGIVVGGPGVSAEHCTLRFNAGRLELRDRGSESGTYINNKRCTEPTILQGGDRIFIGGNIVEIISLVPDDDADQLANAISQTELPLAESASYSQFVVKPLESVRARVKRSLPANIIALYSALIAVLISVPLAIYVTLGTGVLEDIEQLEPSPSSQDKPTSERAFTKIEKQAPTLRKLPRRYTHVTLPNETLSDIAERYGVRKSEICGWNNLNCEVENLEAQKTLKIKHARKFPHPRVRLQYVVGKNQRWKTIAKRFKIKPDTLRNLNPTKIGELSPGDKLTILVDPEPLQRRVVPKQKYEFVVGDARSHGAPNDGWLENGANLPPRPNLYRLHPHVPHYGSKLSIQTIQQAMDSFRKSYTYEGEIIIGGISKTNGGYFAPHNSHQSGRDVDIWLPTIKGFYRHDTKFRKPEQSEVNYFALWGLIESFVKTENIYAIYLTCDQQKNLFDAGVLMGVPRKTLNAAIECRSDGSRLRTALVQHSDGHDRHIHVRFNCSKEELANDCKQRAAPPKSKKTDEDFDLSTTSRG